MYSRPPPPQGAPPSYAFVTRTYRRNLRSVVVGTAFFTAVWTLFSAIGYFRSFAIDRDQKSSQTANLSLAMGVCYITICSIAFFGIFSAAGYRPGMARVYSMLAALATLIITVVGFVRVVTHFVWKDDIITECATLATGGEAVYYGFWGPIRYDILDADEAKIWCRRNWDHSSSIDIVALLITSALACLFTAVAFNYYRQLLDPTSAANASRTPANEDRAHAFPSHYSPPYTSVPNPHRYSNYNAGPYYPNQQYGPPAGPPPGHDATFAPPYEGKPEYYIDGRGHLQDDKNDKDPF